ncbi:MAG: hypothetical protein ABH811_00325 [archaeon]
MDLTITQLIKIILGIVVVVAVVVGFGYFFNDYVKGFFDGLPGLFWSLI